MVKESKTVTHSEEETRLIGRHLGESLAPGVTILVRGELGSGKTVFIQGVAIGLNVPENTYVTSPTYALVNEYQGRCRFYHADLYRLTVFSSRDYLGLEDITDSESIVAIEWPERLPDHFFSSFIDVTVKIIGDDEREISITEATPAPPDVK